MGAELLIGLALAFVVLGPKRMRSMLGQVGRAKAQLDKTTRGIKAQLVAELEGEPAAHNDPETLFDRSGGRGAQQINIMSASAVPLAIQAKAGSLFTD
jgi:Sec-independent protein translocase protein TatA